jgi:hypothetical protein
MIYQKQFPVTFPQGGQHAGMSVAVGLSFHSVDARNGMLLYRTCDQNRGKIGGVNMPERRVNITGIGGQHEPEIPDDIRSSVYRQEKDKSQRKLIKDSL